MVSPNFGTDVMYTSMGLSAISAITNSFEQAASIRAQGDYESTLARTNSAIASLQEKEALEAGDVEAARKNLETKETVSAIKASQAGSGVDVSSGSSVLTRLGVSNVGAIDELTIRNNAARAAWGYQTGALQDTFRGQFSELTAKARSQQTLLTGGLSALEGPLSIEANYLRWSRYMGGGGGESGKPFPMVTG